MTQFFQTFTHNVYACFSLNHCFYCSRTSLENSKRWGTLALVNQLFKIYFKVSSVLACNKCTQVHVNIQYMSSTCAVHVQCMCSTCAIYACAVRIHEIHCRYRFLILKLCSGTVFMYLHVHMNISV